MMYEPRQKVLWFSVISRVSIILLQFIFNALIPDHDTNVFHSPRDSSEKISIYDHAVDILLGGLTRWDAQYFIHIAKYGYTYENTLAFFPMYPLCIQGVAMILKKVLFMLNEHSIIVIAAVSINFFFFVKAAVIFYDLGKQVLGQTSLAYKAAILYCINPASIFFTAAYSESMFAYLTFYSMLGSLQNHRFVYLPIGISTLVRSNGLINIGFPIFAWLQNWYILVLPKIVQEINYYSIKQGLILGLIRTVYSSINTLNTIFLSLVPFVFLQIYIYLRFCTEYYREITIPYHVTLYAKEHILTMPGNDNLTWCRGNLPIAYSKVQDKYWNVGFMRYYEFKQIPNFILATPILCIMLKCIFQYFTNHKEILYLFMGIQNKRHNRTGRAVNRLPKEMFVFVVHGLFLTLFCIVYVHIQVSTRLLASASPLLYWYCASVLSYRYNHSDKSTKELYEEQDNIYSKWRVFFVFQRNYTLTDKFILLYFLGYLVVGCFMYSNFLPWT